MKVDELRRNNNKIDEKLSKSENEDMTKIVAYLRGSQLSNMDQELVRQDILDIVLSAKERGENMSQAIGSDYKQFCDDIIAELHPKNIKEKIRDILTGIFLSVSILILIKMVFYTAEIIRTMVLKQSVNWSVPIQYIDLISMVVIVGASWGIVEVILKDAFDENDKRTNWITFGSFFSIIAVLVLMYAFHIGTGVIFEINLIGGYFTAALLYIISKLGNKIKC